jgi:Fe-S cluster biosynthesis and repair protein YggX
MYCMCKTGSEAWTQWQEARVALPQEEYLNLRLPAELRAPALLSYFFPSKL